MRLLLLLKKVLASFVCGSLQNICGFLFLIRKQIKGRNTIYMREKELKDELDFKEKKCLQYRFYF